MCVAIDIKEVQQRVKENWGARTFEFKMFQKSWDEVSRKRKRNRTLFALKISS